MPGRYLPPIVAALLLVLLAFGVQTAFVRPDDFSASPALVAHYADQGNALVIALGSVAVVLAAGLLLVLNRWLAAALAHHEGVQQHAHGLALEIARGAATVAATLIAAGGAVWSVTVWNSLFYDDLDADATKLLLMLGWMLVSFAAMVAASAMLIATSIGMRSVAAAPSWLERSGYAAAALVLLGPMVVPLFALPVWLLAASIRLRAFRTTPT